MTHALLPALLLALSGQFYQVDTDGDGDPDFYQWNGTAEWRLGSSAGSAGQCIQSGGTGLSPSWGACGGGGGGYATIQDEAVGLTARTTVNFTGAGISCVDNGGSSRTDCTVAGGGGGGDGNAGTTTCDFGAYPSDNDCTVTITGETGILAGSVVEAWIAPIATADHTVDEHILAPIRVYAHTVVAGDGFTITAIYDTPYQQNSPDNNRSRNSPSTTVPRTYGLWSISWRWGVGPGPGVATPGGDDQEIQYNNGGSFDGTENALHTGGNIRFVANPAAAPVAGSLTPHARSEAVPLLASRINGEAAMITGMPWASAHVFMWRPNVSSGISEIGISNAAIQGSASTPVRTTGSMASRGLRNRLLSIAATNQAAGRVGPSGDDIIARETGVWIKFRVSLPAMNSDGLAFVGLTDDGGSIAATSPPSAWINYIGFGKNSGDTNWQIMSNDGTGAGVTHASLGADFPTTTTTAIIDFVLYIPAGGTVTYWANRVDTTVTPVSGTVTTELPSLTTYMAVRNWIASGATIGSAVSLDLFFMVGFKEV